MDGENEEQDEPWLFLEPWEATEETFRKCLSVCKLGVDDSYIVLVHRLSREESSNNLDYDCRKPRTIILRLFDYNENA